MFQTNQWVKSPTGASGSSTMSARLFASAGAPSIRNSGLTFCPFLLNFSGIVPPSWNAELLIFIFAPPAANATSAVAVIAHPTIIIVFILRTQSLDRSANGRIRRGDQSPYVFANMTKNGRTIVEYLLALLRARDDLPRDRDEIARALGLQGRA